jgi:hypothetical protein
VLVFIKQVIQRLRDLFSGSADAPSLDSVSARQVPGGATMEE